MISWPAHSRTLALLVLANCMAAAISFATTEQSSSDEPDYKIYYQQRSSEQLDSNLHFGGSPKLPVAFASAPMRLVRLKASPRAPAAELASCNDGSQPAYYMRLNGHSKSWIIYLQGGGFCSSAESCRRRWQRTPHLMSSNWWPSSKSVDGILSNEPKDNPYLWNANHIYVPYCSSDAWTGQLATRQNSPFTFTGSLILKRVIDSLYDELPRSVSLHEAKYVLLAGDSAGATGVIMNLDRLAAIIEQRSRANNNCTQSSSTASGSSSTSGLPDVSSAGQLGVEARAATCEPPIVRGLADSGWFLDNEPYDGGSSEIGAANSEPSQGDDCDSFRCSPLEAIRQAARHWNGLMPESCVAQHPAEPWRCYFGYRAYQSLKTPLFVVQWLYDEAQLLVDNISRPLGSAGQWQYVNKLAEEMRASLENVTALFAPSCFSHSLVTKASWNQITVNGFKLPHVLNTWEEQSEVSTPPSSSSAGASNLLTLTRQASKTTTDEANSLFEGFNERQRSQTQNPQNATSEFQHVEQEPQIQQPTISMQPVDLQRIATTNPTGQYNHEMTRAAPHSSRQARLRNRKRKRNQQQQIQQQQQQQHQRAKQMQSRTQQRVSFVESLHVDTQVQASIQPSSGKGDPNNELVSSSSANPLQDLLPLMDRSLSSPDTLFSRLKRDPQHSGHAGQTGAAGRLGRSTILDDAVLMSGNSVPEDNQQVTNPEHQRTSDSRWISWQMDNSRTQQQVSNQMPQVAVGGLSILNQPALSGAERFRFIDSCGWPQCNRDCPAAELDMSSGLVSF